MSKIHIVWHLLSPDHDLEAWQSSHCPRESWSFEWPDSLPATTATLHHSNIFKSKGYGSSHRVCTKHASSNKHEDEATKKCEDAFETVVLGYSKWPVHIHPWPVLGPELPRESGWLAIWSKGGKLSMVSSRISKATYVLLESSSKKSCFFHIWIPSL